MKLTDKAKLQIIIALAGGMALLSAFTAANRLTQKTKNPETAQTAHPVQPPVLDLEKAKTVKHVEEAVPRNILFTFNHYRATAAYIAGDFNGWKAEPMKKEGVGLWRARIKILPGVYKYHFLAADKKYRDRYNQRRSGSYSVQIVEPLKTK